MIGFTKCPYETEKSIWKEDPTQWPSVQFRDLCNYFLDYPGPFTREKLKSYKSPEAYNYSESE